MNQTWWESVLHSWPLTLFVPGVVLGLTTLVLIIKFVDGDG